LFSLTVRISVFLDLSVAPTIIVPFLAMSARKMQYFSVFLGTEAQLTYRQKAVPHESEP